jgi:hypothetical protein
MESTQQELELPLLHHLKGLLISRMEMENFSRVEKLVLKTL